MSRRKRYSTEEVRKIMNWSESMLELEAPSVENSIQLHRLSHIQARCTAILLTDERIEELEKKIITLRLQRAAYQNDLTDLMNMIGRIKDEGGNSE